MRQVLFVLLALTCQTAPAQEPPDAVYRKLHNATLGSNLREMLLYATEARKAEIAALPGGAEAVKLISMMMPRTYTVTSTSVSGDGMSAQLRATGAGSFMGSAQQMHGTVNLMKEKGEWKVDKWEWSDKPGGGPAMAPVRVQQKPLPAAEARPAPVQPPAALVPHLVKKPAPPPEPMQDGATHRRQPTNCVIKPVMTDEDLARCGAGR